MTQALQNSLMAKLGLEKLPTEKQADLLIKMAEVVQKRIAMRVVELLPMESLDEYLKIVDNNEIEAQDFLAAKIPNYTAIIDEEINKFKQEIAQ